MELYQLKAFASIAKTCNMTKSARLMNISLSALSTQLKNLEESLNTTLFIRGARGMKLTGPGKELLPSALKVLEAAGALETRAGRYENRVAGPVNIGINTSPKFLEISKISRLMSARYPGVNISYIETQTFETVSMLDEKQIDLGFHYGRLADPHVFSVHLADIRICIVIPERFSPQYLDADFETISKLPWVWTRYGCPFHTALKEKFKEHHLPINQAADAVEENIVRELVKSGTGLGLMRKDEALELSRTGQAAIWEGFELEIPLGLACLEKRKSDAVIARIFELVQNEIKFVNMS